MAEGLLVQPLPRQQPNLYVLGTVHIGAESAQEATLLIETVRPQIVVLEVAPSRVEIIRRRNNNNSSKNDVSNSSNNNSSSSSSNNYNNNPFALLQALPALAYYTLCMSVGSWGLILWANQYATGTLVMAYCVLQPVTALLITIILLQTKCVAACGGELDINRLATGNIEDDSELCLNPPVFGTLCGMVGVFCGLALIINSEPTHHHQVTPSPKTIVAPINQEDNLHAAQNQDEDGFTEYGTLLRGPLATFH